MSKKILKITQTDLDKLLELSMDLGLLQGELFEVEKKYTGTLERLHVDRLLKTINPKKKEYNDLRYKIRKENNG